MYTEIFVIAVVLINLAGFFIRTERPVWAFKFSKRIRSALALDTDRPILIFVGLLIFILVGLAFLSSNRDTLSIIIGITLLPFTILSLLKVLNVLIPPQTKRRAVVTVLDSYVYEGHGETETRQFAICMVSEPNLGVRILPPCPVKGMVQLRPKSNMSAFFRVGGLGLIYRLPFDEW